MTYAINETHDPSLRSWIESANDPASDFPLQNLPFGRFSHRGGMDTPYPCVAVGDFIVDLAGARNEGVISVDLPLNARSDEAAFTPGMIHQLRVELIDFLRSENRANVERVPGLAESVLIPMSSVDLLLPVKIGDYTDFYASAYHASNVGRMFRPDSPLLPNYKWIPIGYHGRASSIVVSDTPVRRPLGQTRPDNEAPPVFGPSKVLDYEIELGAVVGTPNDLGTRVSMEAAEDHLLGICLLNDWSARDIQKWEYQPLGPFLAKSFATTVSPWLVTMEALAPFRLPAFNRPPDDPQPLPHLDSTRNRLSGGLDIDIVLYLSSRRMRQLGEQPVRLVKTNSRYLYWTFAQMLAHHTSNGCNLRTGDLLGSGTISGDSALDADSAGCLLEATWQGTKPIELPGGETRRFLEDGDEVIIKGHCNREGFRRIGFGECRGVVVEAEDILKA